MGEKYLMDLADEVNALCRSAEMERRKHLWETLLRGEAPAEKIPVKCSPFMAGHYDLVWQRLMPEETLHCSEGLARHLEIQLRKKIFKFRYLRDDDVILPTVWVFSREVIPPIELWGVRMDVTRPQEVGGAYKEIPLLGNEEDLGRVTLPRFLQDREADNETARRAVELVDGRIPIKLYGSQVSFSPYEYAVRLRGAEPLLFDLYDRPQFVHRLMSRVTEGIVSYARQREAAGAFDVEETLLLHEPWDRVEPGTEHKLSSAWVYISAQSSAGLGPEMYAEFVHPYHERIAPYFKKVYYHGCEDLGKKVASIVKLPNLKHFHVSPWTSLADVAPHLAGKKIAMEVHAHPTNVLFVFGPEEIRAEARRRMDEAQGLPMDYVLCDLQTIDGADGKLQMWCDIAMEESVR